MTLDWSFLRLFKVFLSSLETLLCAGSRALGITAAELVLTASLESSGGWRMAASISATMLLCGMLVGVEANLGPFSKRDRSSGKVVTWRGSQPSCFCRCRLFENQCYSS